MRFAIVIGGWLWLFPTGPLKAQGPEPEPLQVVRRLFDAMRSRDTAAMRAALHPEARLVSAGTREGVPVVTTVSPDRWISGVAGAPDGVLDERLRNPVVHIDGGLASVWTEYTFYVGDRLSHCGVDAFHLIRLPEGWRIIDLADTRRRDGCPP